MYLLSHVVGKQYVILIVLLIAGRVLRKLKPPLRSSDAGGSARDDLVLTETELGDVAARAHDCGNNPLIRNPSISPNERAASSSCVMLRHVPAATFAAGHSSARLGLVMLKIHSHSCKDSLNGKERDWTMRTILVGGLTPTKRTWSSKGNRLRV